MCQKNLTNEMYQNTIIGHKHWQSSKTCRLCIKFDTFYHLSDKTCRRDKTCRNRRYGGGGSGREIYLSLHCHHQNDSCIKVGSDECHFNVSVGSDGQSQDSVHKPQPFWRERRAEAASNRGPNALPLGQTGSLTVGIRVKCSRPEYWN